MTIADLSKAKGQSISSSAMLMMSSTLTTVATFLGGGLSCLLLVKLLYKMTTGVFESDKVLTGKTVLVTGCNRGIGRETVKDLAGRRAKIIMACRNVVEAKQVAKEISEETGNENIEVLKLDLSSQKSIRQFASLLLDRNEKLDILINNAGMVGSSTGQLSEDGLEAHYATNLFGPFLLTILLLPLMLTGSPSRIINLTSIMHFFGRINVEDVYGQSKHSGPFSGILMYSNTKLAMNLFTRALSSRLKGTGVTVNAVHPGNTQSNIANNVSKWLLVFGPLIKMLVVKNPVEGARTTIYAALSEQLEGVSGAYLADCKEAYSSPASRNDKEADRLWDLCCSVTGLSGKNLILDGRVVREDILNVSG